MSQTVKQNTVSQKALSWLLGLQERLLSSIMVVPKGSMKTGVPPASEKEKDKLSLQWPGLWAQDSTEHSHLCLDPPCWCPCPPCHGLHSLGGSHPPACPGWCLCQKWAGVIPRRSPFYANKVGWQEAKGSFQKQPRGVRQNGSFLQGQAPACHQEQKWERHYPEATLSEPFSWEGAYPGHQPAMF